MPDTGIAFVAIFVPIKFISLFHIVGLCEVSLLFRIYLSAGKKKSRKNDVENVIFEKENDVITHTHIHVVYCGGGDGLPSHTHNRRDPPTG